MNFKTMVTIISCVEIDIILYESKSSDVPIMWCRAQKQLLPSSGLFMLTRQNGKSIRLDKNVNMVSELFEFELTESFFSLLCSFINRKVNAMEQKTLQYHINSLNDPAEIMDYIKLASYLNL